MRWRWTQGKEAQARVPSVKMLAEMGLGTIDPSLLADSDELAMGSSPGVP